MAPNQFGDAYMHHKTSVSWSLITILPVFYGQICGLPILNTCIALLSIYSQSGRMSYHKVSWSLKATWFGFRLLSSLRNLTGTPVALLPRCLSNSRAIRWLSIQSHGFESSRDPYIQIWWRCDLFFNYRPENFLLLKILEKLKHNRLIYIDNNALSYGKFSSYGSNNIDWEDFWRSGPKAIFLGLS